MTIEPGWSWRTSSAAVWAFMQTRTGVSRRCPTYPLALARMWNQVGSPSMFEGKTFLPLHGMPIPYRARSRTRLADWLPEPLTVPTRMARSLTEAGDDRASFYSDDTSTTETVDDMVCLEAA